MMTVVSDAQVYLKPSAASCVAGLCIDTKAGVQTTLPLVAIIAGGLARFLRVDASQKEGDFRIVRRHRIYLYFIQWP